jgi:hypothetical protein
LATLIGGIMIIAGVYLVNRIDNSQEANLNDSEKSLP